MRKRFFVVVFAGMVIGACSNNGNNDNGNGNEEPIAETPVLAFTVVNVFPHDTTSFTEGFLIHEGKLYESTGSPDNEIHNGSWLGIVDLKTGKADKKVKLDPVYFGEGITILNGKIYQLTYQNHKGFVYDAKTYAKFEGIFLRR